MAKSRDIVRKEYGTWLCVFLLIGFGLMMVYSTSSYKAELMFGNPLYWFLRQSLWAVIGTVVMIMISCYDYRKLYKNPKILLTAYFAVSILLILTLVLGSVTKGSKRWLSLGPLSFQPSELSKLVLILFMAFFLSHHEKLGRKMKGTFVFFLISLPVIGPVAVENASTSIILLAIVGIMIFAACPWYKRFFLMILLGITMIVLIIGSRAYRMERFIIWLDPESHPKGFQTMQGLYAIGSGGLFGKGFGNSMQKLGFLPEPQNDMIFSIICEELGLVGAFFVLGLFLCLLIGFLKIAFRCGDLFGFLIVIGVMAHLGVQIFINVAVVTNTIPNTGIPLPFISYGGSSLFFLLAEVGMVFSVAGHSSPHSET